MACSFLFRRWVLSAWTGLGILCTPLLARDPVPVTLQLKWTHQFQFAGYYAALEKGYYREAGLDVRIREATAGLDPTEEVLSGRAEYGVATSELALHRAQGRPVVALAAIFQHSPLVILARRDRGIQNLQDLAGKSVMLTPQETEILAYLRREGLGLDRFRSLPHSLNVEDFIRGRCDAYVGYTTDDLFAVRTAGLDVQLFTPQSAGIDFYGDCLFTSEREARRNPEQVRAFREASLRGWHYAVAHPDEVVDLILARYAPRKGRAHLSFEAKETIHLIQPGLVELGYMNPGRWRHIASTYAEAGFAAKDVDLKGFLFEPEVSRLPPWAWRLGIGTALLALAAGVVAFSFLRLNRRLRHHIAEHQAAEEEVRRTDERLQSLIQNSPDNIFFLRVEGPDRYVVEAANPAMARAVGLEETSLVGMDVRDAIPPGLVQRVLANYRRCVEEAAPIRYQETAPAPCGRTLHYETLLVPSLDGAGRVVRLAGISRDITAHMEAEEAVRHSEKLESLGIMAGAIAHDFNNLFQSILGNLELAALRPSRAEEDLRRARASLERAAELSRRMLDFSGKGLRDPRQMNLATLLQDLPTRLPADLQAPDRFRIQTLEPGLIVEGDASQLRQVVEALVLNGLEALGPPGGLVTLRLFAFPFSPSTPRDGLWPLVPTPGPKACVEVRDTGPGIPREHLDRLFEPFFSTKAHGRGLGLAAALGILRAHGAGLQVLSEPGMGTTLRIYLAQVKPIQPETLPMIPIVEAPRSQEHRTVLLVDDEPALREILADMLREALGYEVLVAQDGIEAEAVFREHQARIGLILMDATMPRRGGVEAFHAIRAIAPGVQALLISGFGEAFGQETAKAHGFIGFLKKPFRLDDLRRALVEALPDAP